MSWVEALVPHIRALHLAFLALWIAGLLAMPRMLARHEGSMVTAEYALIRRATHYTYVWGVTPAAVLAIASGTALIFLREVFTPWIFAKLVLVAGLVAVHAWVGHTIIAVAETEGEHDPPGAMVPTVITLALVVAILLLVLAKPELEEITLPSWLMSPLGRHLPFDVPNR